MREPLPTCRYRPPSEKNSSYGCAGICFRRRRVGDLHARARPRPGWCRTFGRRRSPSVARTPRRRCNIRCIPGSDPAPAARRDSGTEPGDRYSIHCTGQNSGHLPHGKHRFTSMNATSRGRFFFCADVFRSLGNPVFLQPPLDDVDSAHASIVTPIRTAGSSASPVRPRRIAAPSSRLKNGRRNTYRTARCGRSKCRRTASPTATRLPS